MSPPPPILNLEQIRTISTGGRPLDGPSLCHVYGLFTQEETTPNTSYWLLSDETTCTGGLRIKLCGQLEDYPKPRPGDVVRVHRLSFDRNLQVPMVPHARNVIVWRAFEYNPTPLTIARAPTLDETDIEKRRILETFYCSKITRVEEMLLMAKNPAGRYIDAAGRVEEKSYDNYNNLVIKFHDGTGCFSVRVFPKKQDFEKNVHFETALELQVGQFFLVTNAKLDSRSNVLNVSASTIYGRSLRIVDRASILGVQLSQALDKIALCPAPTLPSTSNDNNHEAAPGSSQNGDSAIPTLRRSPRFSQAQSIISTDSTVSPPSTQQQQPESQPQQRTVASPSTINNNNNNANIRNNNNPVQNLPNYTKISDVEKTPDGFYKFYDIAGQVRSPPNEARYYENWVFQLFDGSGANFRNFYVDEVKEPAEECVAILVYSKQKANDTDRHIQTVKKLNEGDLVLVKNVKVSWRGGRIKLEMNANLEHGKSINVIDKNSPFGVHLMEIVTNPFVEELREDHYETPPSQEKDSSYHEESPIHRAECET